MIQFLRGALTLACVVVALFFWRFWRESQDRLHAFFGAAFALFAIHWAVLAFHAPHIESAHYIYVVRFFSFALILFAILDKNRRESP